MDNFMEKFFGTKRLHKRIYESDSTSDCTNEFKKVIVQAIAQTNLEK